MTSRQLSEQGFDLYPDLQATLASDPGTLLYAYGLATGGWFLDASPRAAELGVPYEHTPLAITRSAIYWLGYEQREVAKRGFFGRERNEREWLRTTCRMSVSDVEHVTVSREGFDAGYASWPREQHLALEVRAKGRAQTFYNWSSNSADVLRDVAAILVRLGLSVDDRAGALPP